MNSEASILIKLQCVILSMVSSQRALQTNENLFSIFEFVLEFLAENRKIFEQIARKA